MVGAAVRRAQTVLFVRQRTGALAGQWCLPTGLVEPGEPPELAAVRETREAAGIVAVVRGVLAVSNSVVHGQHQRYLVFLCDHVAGDPAPDGVETDRAAYLSLAEIADTTEPFVLLVTLLARRVAAGSYHVLPVEDIQAVGPWYATTFL